MSTTYPPSSARSTAAEGERRPVEVDRSGPLQNPDGTLAGDAARRELGGASRGSSSGPGVGEGDFESALMGKGGEPACAQPAAETGRPDDDREALRPREPDVTDARPGRPGTDYRAPADRDPPTDGSTHGSTE